MITQEEVTEFEKLFEQLKLYILSDGTDKMDNITTTILQIIHIKNEGNQTKTAKELGLTTRTVRSYLRKFEVSRHMMDMHLNTLTSNSWFKELPTEEQEMWTDLVIGHYKPNDLGQEPTVPS